MAATSEKPSAMLEERRSRLRLMDAEAWQAYARACQRGAPPKARGELFRRAMVTLMDVARFERVHGTS